MRDLAEGKMSDDPLKSLWIQRLPTSMQTILVTYGDELDKLAVMVDKIHNITAPSVFSLEIAPVATNTPLTAATTPSISNFRDYKNTQTLFRKDKDQIHVDAEDQ